MSPIGILLLYYAIHTIALGVVLWLMIKFQDFQFKFPPLIGMTILASAFAMIPLVGRPLASWTLYIWLKKMTDASLVPDLTFTVGISFALMFGVKLLIMPPLIQHFARESDFASFTNRLHMTDLAMTPPRTAPSAAAIAARAVTNATATNPAAQHKSADEILKDVTVKGATENGEKSMLIISAKNKTYTLAMNDPEAVITPSGSCSIKLVRLSGSWATVEVNGEAAYLQIH